MSCLRNVRKKMSPPKRQSLEGEQNMAISFQDALKDLINRHSMENGSDTPDFLLAEYLCDCLASYEVAVTKREKWYGRDKKVSGGTGDAPAYPHLAQALSDLPST